MWQGALLEELVRLWRLRWQVTRILFGQGKGDTHSLPVYWHLGRLIALMRWRDRYNTGFELIANLVRNQGRPAARNLT